MFDRELPEPTSFVGRLELTMGDMLCKFFYVLPNEPSGNEARDLANPPSYPLDRPSRYEATLWRQAGQILFALDGLDCRKPQDRGRRFRIGGRPELPAYERDECLTFEHADCAIA